MIIKRCQRTRYAMIGHDRVLISDAEVELYPILDLKTAKHDTHARKELVPVGARATRPSCVVEAKFRPKVFQKMKLRGHAGQECIADVVPPGSAATGRTFHKSNL